MYGIKKRKERLARSRSFGMLMLRSLIAIILCIDMWLILLVWYNTHLDHRTAATLFFFFGEWACIKGLKWLLISQLKQ